MQQARESEVVFLFRVTFLILVGATCRCMALPVCFFFWADARSCNADAGTAVPAKLNFFLGILELLGFGALAFSSEPVAS